jgi:hypothetical protein
MGDEFRTGLVTGIMKFVPAVIAAEVRFILCGEKRTFMMIEPPGQFVRSRVFEIDNGVFIRPE